MPDIRLQETMIEVQVFEESPGKWCAMIAGGWYMAIGETMEGAIKSVMARYQSEKDYLP